MARALVLALLAVPASAFVAPVAPQPISRAAALNAEMSPSLPMLPRPQKLKGWTGDVGFDPLGLSEWVAVEWLRESDLKHSRVAMLAVVGYMATDCGFRLPGDVHAVSSLAAHNTQVATGGMAQIFAFLFLFETLSYFAIVEMLEGSGRKPGDYGFDPLGFTKGMTDEAFSAMQLKELKNGRLAMLAIGGIVTQDAIFEKGFP